MTWLLQRRTPHAQEPAEWLGVVTAEQAAVSLETPRRVRHRPFFRRKNIEDALPFTVPVEPNAWKVLLIGVVVSTLWLGLATLGLVSTLLTPRFEFLLQEQQTLWWVVAIVIGGAVAGIALTFIIFNPLLMPLVCQGSLTIDRHGMQLQIGPRQENFTWSKPIRVTRWDASFIDPGDNVVAEGIYEVQRFEQGSARATLSRRQRLKRRRLLSEYVSEGTSPNTDKGLLIGLKGGLVFDAIEQLGDVQITQ
jgi:hypothetical protein